jgi:hypothetical protein
MKKKIDLSEGKRPAAVVGSPGQRRILFAFAHGMVLWPENSGMRTIRQGKKNCKKSYSKRPIDSWQHLSGCKSRKIQVNSFSGKTRDKPQKE